jgi:hypothetical protein
MMPSGICLIRNRPPVPDLEIPPTFKKLVDSKPPQLAGAILKCVRLLGENPRHPGLQTHPIRGVKPKVFEAYVDRANRVTFKYKEGKIVLLNNCNHDIINRPHG